MLSASTPSAAASSSAASRMRSRERPEGCACDLRAIEPCIVRCTQDRRRQAGREDSVGGRSTARTLVWVAFAAQALFFTSWIVAGALEPHYSHIDEFVSDLAAKNAAHPWIDTIGIVALGLSLLALAAALPAALERRRALPILLFAAAGLGSLLAAAFPLDCMATVDHHCKALQDAGDLSWQHYTHLWASLANQVALLLTPFALARALWPGTTAAVFLACGGTGIAIGAAMTAAYAAQGAADGLIQRFGFLVLLVWVLIVGG